MISQYLPEDLLELERQFSPSFYQAALEELKPFYAQQDCEYVAWIDFLDAFPMYLNL